MTPPRRAIPVDTIGPTPTEIVLAPDDAARAALAHRLGVPALPALTCRFLLRRDRADTVLADCVLDGRVIQDDVATLDPFEAPLHEDFSLRFVPEDRLTNTIDPNDPCDEVGYTDGRLDLGETMAQQVALALDPYPRLR